MKVGSTATRQPDQQFNLAYAELRLDASPWVTVQESRSEIKSFIYYFTHTKNSSYSQNRKSLVFCSLLDYKGFPFILINSSFVVW